MGHVVLCARKFIGGTFAVLLERYYPQCQPCIGQLAAVYAGGGTVLGVSRWMVSGINMVSWKRNGRKAALPGKGLWKNGRAGHLTWQCVTLCA